MSTAKSKAPLTASAFLGSAVKGVKPADAFFHVLPVPFVGERFKQSSMAAAPDAILQASQHLETWDGRSNASRHGIHTHAAVDCKGPAEKVMQKIAAEVSAINSVDDRKVPCPGPITKQVAETYGKAVRGQIPQYAHWCELAK